MLKTNSVCPTHTTLSVRYNTALLITGGYWMFGAKPESDGGWWIHLSDGGYIRSVVTGLASPLQGAESGWEYYDDGVWQTDKLLSVKGIIMRTHN